MPDFATFKGKDLDGDLTKEEEIRALRFAMAAEMETIQLYEQLANASSNKMFKKVMLSIVDEEKVHVGEFMKTLFTLAPGEKIKYGEGFKEAKGFK